MSTKQRLEKQIRSKAISARVIFFILAGLTALGIGTELARWYRKDWLSQMEAVDCILAFGLPAIFAIAFLTLGILFKRNPYGIALTGLILYAFGTVIDIIFGLAALSDGMELTFSYGWIIKVAVLIFLFNALGSCKKYALLEKKIRKTDDSIDAELIE